MLSNDFAVAPGVASLSFVARRKSGTLDLWRPLPMNTWAAGNAHGRECAGELVDYIANTGDLSALPHIVETMAREEFGPVEIGFFTGLASRLTS